MNSDVFAVGGESFNDDDSITTLWISQLFVCLWFFFFVFFDLPQVICYDL